MRRWPFLACFVLACGSDAQAVFDSGADTTSASEASTDVFVERAPSVALTDGGPFLCRGCICNGADHECLEIGHVIPPSPVDGGFGDAQACDPDADFNGCVAIPADCMPTPSCDCVLAHASFAPDCTCELDPSDSGIVVQCILP